MRQQVANTVFVSALCAQAGCSLIYNPSNLPDPKSDAGADSPIDAEVMADADPSMLLLERTFPTTIFEGAGSSNSRRGVLTIHGMHLVPEATVNITLHDNGMPATMIMVDNTLPDRVAENGRMIAVPITVMVDNGLAAGTDIRLDVSVTQPTQMGDKTVELKEVNGGPALVLKGLPELTSGATIQLAGGDYLYSSVAIQGDLEVTGDAPLVITSMSTVNVTGAVKASSTSRQGVAGGGDGGAPGAALSAGGAGVGAGPAMTGGGGPNGGGGGHATAGAGGAEVGGAAYGEDQIITAYPGSGGAGGNGGALAAGGAGGGGGGVVEIIAQGDLSVGTVEAKGGNGLANNGGSTGGGGSGGSIFLRSYGTLTANMLVVDGGMGLNVGAPGRARYDAAMGPMTIGTAYRGPMFHPSTPLITRSEKPTLTITGKPNEQFQYFWESEDGQGIRGPFNSAIAGNGTNGITLPEALYRGSNQVCLLVKGAQLSNTNREARTCIQIVYLHRFAQ